jgi:hypothetical protein
MEFEFSVSAEKTPVYLGFASYILVGRACIVPLVKLTPTCITTIVVMRFWASSRSGVSGIDVPACTPSPAILRVTGDYRC